MSKRPKQLWGKNELSVTKARIYMLEGWTADHLAFQADCEIPDSKP